MADHPQQGPTPAPGVQQSSPPHGNPEIGIGDISKLLQAIAEAVLTGQTEVPAIHFRIAGQSVTYGPSPVKVG